MDMKCRRCGEPWDWWYLRDDVLNSKIDGEKVDLFPLARKQGLTVDDNGNGKFVFTPGPYVKECPACPAESELTEADRDREFLYSAMQEILGDDIDGFMAEIEDLGL